jgi:hypothetical protein
MNSSVFILLETFVVTIYLLIVHAIGNFYESELCG